MKIKSFLITVYTLSGLFIATFTAFMTYLIIDEPVGMKMFSKISFIVLLSLPVIGLLSFIIGHHLSKKLEKVNQRLSQIESQKFLKDDVSDFISDISDIHFSISTLSSKLEEHIHELRAKNENLIYMIRSLSHDIKTPLTIISGYLEEFEDGLVHKSDEKRHILTMKKEITYINELSTEVISYLRSTHKENKKEKLNLKEIIEKEVFPHIKVEKDVCLEHKVDHDMDLSFNKIDLKKILINLLHNSSKFTSQGQIQVFNKENIIYIEDSGTGIKEEFIEKVFEPFFCLDESKNRQKSGFGLGLSIAKNLAGNNGFDLCLDSSYTQGCRFYLLERAVK